MLKKSASRPVLASFRPSHVDPSGYASDTSLAAALLERPLMRG